MIRQQQQPTTFLFLHFIIIIKSDKLETKLQAISISHSTSKCINIIYFLRTKKTKLPSPYLFISNMR